MLLKFKFSMLMGKKKQCHHWDITLITISYCPFSGSDCLFTVSFSPCTRNVVITLLFRNNSVLYLKFYACTKRDSSLRTSESIVTEHGESSGTRTRS